MEELFNSSEKIVQRSDSKRSEDTVHNMPEQRPANCPVAGMHSVHSSSSVDHPVNRSKARSTGAVDRLSCPNFLLATVDRSVDRRKGSVD